MALIRLDSYSKYSNKKTEIDGIIFHSQKEAYRYKELKLLEKAKHIYSLALQTRFMLQEAFEKQGEHFGQITYLADFTYYEAKNKNIWIVEDVKGMKTDVYKLKKKLLLYRYKNIELREL